MTGENFLAAVYNVITARPNVLSTGAIALYSLIGRANSRKVTLKIVQRRLRIGVCIHEAWALVQNASDFRRKKMCRLFHPRNPELQCNTGQAKDKPAGEHMRTIRLALLAAVVLAASASSFAGVFVSVGFAPPELPVYVQPVCPAPGYIWTPGYWAYGDEGYFWVPGTWVEAPFVGGLWTPGYWGWGDGVYLFHPGYWGLHVGFYGGVNYGFGYVGTGYLGGRWNNGVFAYNRTVNNVNVTNIHNTYNETVVNNTTVNRVSYNGGTGGIQAKPTPAEQAAEHEQHTPPRAEQLQHEREASTNRMQLASVNHGQPAVAATPKPGAFKGPGVVAAKPASASARASADRAAANHAAAKGGAATNANNANSRGAKSNVPRPGNSRAGAAGANTARPATGDRNVPRPSAGSRANPSTGSSRNTGTQTRTQGVPRPPNGSRVNSPSGGNNRPDRAAQNNPAPRAERSAPAPRPQAERPAPAPRPQAERPARNNPPPHQQGERPHQR